MMMLTKRKRIKTIRVSRTSRQNGRTTLDITREVFEGTPATGLNLVEDQLSTYTPSYRRLADIATCINIRVHEGKGKLQIRAGIRNLTTVYTQYY